MLENVLWVFFSPQPELIASYRVSGILPADNLKIKKGIFLENDDPIKFFSINRSKLVIFAKPFHTNAINLALEAVKQNIKIILTCDDWNFDKSNLKRAQINEIMTSIAKISNSVVVKTNIAAEIVKKNTNIDCDVIPDCIESKGFESINNISYPFKLGWCGKHTNWDTLYYGILEILKYDILANLTVITNFTKKFDNFKYNIKELKQKKILINFIEWSPNYHSMFYNTDIILVPYIYDNRRLVKSINRITDALNLGKIVVSSKMPFNKNLNNYCVLGNLGEGLKWIKNNKKEALIKAKLGKEWSTKNFNIEKISQQWLDLIKQLSEFF